MTDEQLNKLLKAINDFCFTIVVILTVICFLLIVITITAKADPLPNLNITPGMMRNQLTLDQICNIKWGKDHRNVTANMKLQVFQSYGFPKGNRDSRCPCEIDHLISRELGGEDHVKNLWVQSYSGDWNAHMKDRLENRLHAEVCAGHITLDQAQTMITNDWVKLYIQYFGVDK